MEIQNNKSFNNLELLSPAGSFEAIDAAIKAGTDAVYFGVEQLNMRACSSNNFTLKDMERSISHCHDNGVKSYVTLNTIIYNHDLNLMKKICDKAKEAGADAIIASDHSVMAYSKKIGLPVHISTQSNVTNIDSLEFYAAFGDTVVLARELSLAQVKEVSQQIKERNITGPSGKLVNIEIFCHGALCMAVSGKCYLSLHSNFASANRGACVQNCRREYIVTDKESGEQLLIDNDYIMSPKDLCTIDFLDKIADAGVTVLKIEGRSKSPDYVYETTSCYREAIDSLNEGTYSLDKIEEWKNRLSTVYNRGFWDGYYLGRKMGEWSGVYGSKATEKRVFVGKGLNYFKDIKVGFFRLNFETLSVGDKIVISGPTTGFIKQEVKELRVDDKIVTAVKKGDSFSMPVNELMRPQDKLYKIVDAVLSNV